MRKVSNYWLKGAAFISRGLRLSMVVSVIVSFALVGCDNTSSNKTALNQQTANMSLNAKTTTVTNAANTGMATTETAADKRAESLAQQFIITDTHVDLPFRLYRHDEDVATMTETGDFDYPRAKRGGLDAPFMSIYVPSKLDGTAESFQVANQLIDRVEKLVEENPDKFALAFHPDDLIKNKQKGLISLPMGMENGAPIGNELKNLKHFYNRGIRYITLTHAKANQISDSSYDENRPNQGLSDFGKQVVKEMNRIGIMVDVSHISDQAFLDVMATSEVPVIASHSSARHFTPGFERNMSDEMIKQLAAKGGVIQINFGSSFISQKANDYSNQLKQAREKFMEEHQLERDSDKVKAFVKRYREKNPPYFATLDEVLDHFDHVRDLVGVDHLGIGSDFDGVGDSLPVGLKDVSAYPNLINGLLKRGYSEKDIEKITSGNLIRVWKQVEAFANNEAMSSHHRSDSE